MHIRWTGTEALPHLPLHAQYTCMHVYTHTHTHTHTHTSGTKDSSTISPGEFHGSSETARKYLFLRATHKIKKEKFLLWACLSERKCGISYDRISNSKFTWIPNFLQPKQCLFLFSKEGSISQAYFKCSGGSSGPGNLRPLRPDFWIDFIMQVLSCRSPALFHLWNGKKTCPQCHSHPFKGFRLVGAHWHRALTFLCLALGKTGRQNLTMQLKYFLYKNYANPKASLLYN